MSLFFRTFSRILGFLSAIFIFFGIIFFIMNFYSKSFNQNNFIYYKGNQLAESKIALLNIEGPIVSKPLNIYNFSRFTNINAIYPSQIENYLKELEEKNIKGLIVSINSPGGSVSASFTIFNILEKFKTKNKIPIYFHTSDMIASGAYWVSLSADKIYANYGALIGSIGVKGPDWIYYNNPTSYSSGLLGTSIESPEGIKLFSNTAGISKDILNPFRSPSKIEIQKLQLMVDDIYDDFIREVSSKRKIEINVIKNEIGAMIFNSSEAQKIYLIDDEKNINETIKSLSKKLNLDEFQVITNKNFFNYSNFNALTNLQSKINRKEIKDIINSKFCNNIQTGFSVATFRNNSIKC